MDPANWTWGYGSSVVADGGMLKCILTSEWGAMAIGWNEPTRDLSEWDKIVIVVEKMNGCDGEWFKLKAYLRDYVNKDSEQGQMEASLGLDAPDNQQNYLVINLKEVGKNVNLTACGVLAIQCQPNGAEFKISRVYLEKEVEETAKYYVVGNMTDWSVNEAYEMTPNNGAETEEYMYEMALTTASQFKVVKVDGATQTWYPDGMGNNYGEHGEIAKDGDYTIYFRPKGDGGEGWFYNCIYAAKKALPKDETVIYVAFPPVNRPENIEVAGTFEAGAWGMRVFNGDWYTCNEDLYTSAEDILKFRDADNHDIVLCQRIPANGEGEDKWVQLLLKCSDFAVVSWKGEMTRLIEEQNFFDTTNYAWMIGMPEPDPQGIENIVLTEKAQKVMVDGVLYIVRDGKMFNLNGAQVR